MSEPSFYDHLQTALSIQPDRTTRYGRNLLPAISPSLSCLTGGFPLAGISANPADDPKLGVICRLPAADSMRQQPSIVNIQDHLNDGAFEHPCVPVAAAETFGVRYLFCCLATSFGSTSITEKFARCRDDNKKKHILNCCIPIQGTGKETGPLADCILHEELERETGSPLRKRTYVRLDQGFWIEETHLQAWNSKGTPHRLTAESLNALQWAYFVAEDYRAHYDNFSRIPGSRSPSPSPPPQEYGFYPQDLSYWMQPAMPMVESPDFSAVWPAWGFDAAAPTFVPGAMQPLAVY